MRKIYDIGPVYDDFYADYVRHHVREENTNRVHSHAYCELLVINRGDIIYIAQGKMVKLRDKAVIYNRANMIHNNFVQNEHLYERYRINFYEKDVLPQGVDASVLQEVLSASFAKELNDEDFDLIYELSKSVKNAVNGQVDSLIDKIKVRRAIELIMLTAASAKERAKQKDTSYIEDVAKYINRHLNEKLTIEKIASEFFISRGKLIYDFKAYCNMSINEYITMERLEAAKKLLISGNKVSAVAEECGFSTASYFINVFSSLVGITPLQYQIANAKTKKRKTK